ncbi:hypothetical protein ACIF83_13920, partial [Streptomyces sp. NPDC085866]
MGRHSRRGPAPKDDSADIAARRGGRGSASGTPRETRQPTLPGQRRAPEGAPQGYGTPGTAQGAPGVPPGTPAGGAPRFPDGTPAQGVPRFPGGTPAHGTPRLPD